MNIIADKEIRKKAKQGIDRADDTTVKMILAMLDVKEKESKHETAFELEIEKRIEEYEQGKIIPLSLSELEAKVKMYKS